MAYQREYPDVDPNRYNDNWLLHKMKCLIQDFLSLENRMSDLEDFVKNYFDNLDIPSEVSNKIDQMIADGSFQEIVNDYLNGDFINVRLEGAKGDGISNDTAIIMEAAAKAKSERKRLYFPAGIYICNAEIIVWEGCHIFGDGIGATVIRCNKESNGQMINIPQAEYTSAENNFTNYVTISDITLDGNHLIKGHGIRALGCRDWLIRRVEVCNQQGYGIGFQGFRNGAPINRSGVAVNVHIEDCYIHDNGAETDADGIDFKDSDACVITGCLIVNNGDNGIDFRGRNGVIENCYCRGTNSSCRLRCDTRSSGRLSCSVNNCILGDIDINEQLTDALHPPTYHVNLSNLRIDNNKDSAYGIEIRFSTQKATGVITVSDIECYTMSGIRVYSPANDHMNGIVKVSDFTWYPPPNFTQNRVAVRSGLAEAIYSNIVAPIGDVFQWSEGGGAEAIFNSPYYGSISDVWHGIEPKVFNVLSRG